MPVGSADWLDYDPINLSSLDQWVRNTGLWLELTAVPRPYSWAQAAHLPLHNPKRRAVLQHQPLQASAEQPLLFRGLCCLILFFLEPTERSCCNSPGREQSWRAAGSGGVDLLSCCETELEGARMRGRGIDLAAAAG